MSVAAELADPSTPALRLAHIAQTHPEHAATIAQHPNAYPELVAWASSVRVPDAMTTPPDRAPRFARTAWAIAAGLFIVPSTVMGLWFALAPGSYYGLLGSESGQGIEFFFGSGRALINPLVGLMLLGFPAALIGAIGAPTMVRRVWAIVVWTLALILEFFPIFLGGSEILVPLAPVPLEWPLPAVIIIGFVSSVLLLTAWILSWPLGGRAFFVVAIFFVTTAAAVLLAPGYYGGVIGTLAIIFVRLIVPVGIILLAPRLSASGRRRTTAAAPASVVQGEVPRNNTMAILSLVFAFFVSILAVVFGHVALGQIRRTGESGRGMAIAGLVLGYIGIAVTVIGVIIWAVMFGTLMSYRGY